ncbi:MAG: outer membrane protein assembly factor BamA [Omnitrophica WOR_2 bacterium RIFOXYC2_FULL_45_15]|nr:MAG: outer membrane protein assembly factor BamA [Omnitrophica WOR_2 bacterium RIFOXYC2_FULL_45_15]
MRTKYFLFFIIGALALLSKTAYAQGSANQTAEERSVLGAVVDPGEPETALKSAQSPPAVSRVEPPVEKKITAIEVQGNRFISSAVILSKIKTRLGSVYSTNIISEDIKRVNELGYFSDIKIDTQDFEEGLKVFIIVTEKSLIGKIVFKGYFSRIIREEKLRETIKLKEGQYLDEVQLREDLQTIKDACVKKGYPEARITQGQVVSPETNKVILTITIDSGARMKIKKFDIRGNKNLKTKRLIKLMKSRRAGFFSSGFYKEDLLKDDIERLKSFYRREGYTDAKIDYETGYGAKKGWMFVVIRIEEGKKYVIGQVRAKGNTVFGEDEIIKSLKALGAGKVFSPESMHEGASDIQSLYFDKGYIFAQASESSYLNPDTDRVDVTYSIDEGIIGYVDKVKIRGNIKTKDKVIRRELRIYPGERFDGDKLKRSKERLRNLGFFEEVGYDIEPSDSPDPSKRNLVVDVKESKTGEFSFGGGYSSVDSLIGFIEVAQKNFDWKNFPYFTGGGQDLRFRAELGSITTNFEMSFTEPWMWDYPVSFGFDAYRRARDRETDVGYGYSEKRTGGDLRLGKELNEYLRADTMYKIEEVDISNASSDATADLIKEVGTNIISSMQFGLTRDTRDNIFSPSKGYVLAGTFELAGGPFGGDKDFVKFTTANSKYFGLFNSSVLEFRLRAGLTDAYANSGTVPIYERFYAGGAYSIRGYHERKIGPIDPVSKDPIGGDSMLVGNIEYLYPIVDFIKGAVFYDTGNVWRKMSDFASGDFKSGFGFGVRVKTPIGPMRLDYGWPLNKEPGEPSKGKGRFHFSLSHGF